MHSPLVGPSSWDLIAPALAEPGRPVTIPDLTSTAYEDEAVRAAGLGWPVIRLASHHLALLTDPAEVAEAISELLRACH